MPSIWAKADHPGSTHVCWNWPLSPLLHSGNISPPKQNVQAFRAWAGEECFQVSLRVASTTSCLSSDCNKRWRSKSFMGPEPGALNFCFIDIFWDGSIHTNITKKPSQGLIPSFLTCAEFLPGKMAEYQSVFSCRFPAWIVSPYQVFIL